MKLKTHRIPGLVLTDHSFTVPLDHARPEGEQIAVYAREAIAPEREESDLPWLVFFQGGPGSGSPRPIGNSGWLKRALREYRVLLLDQRGTGHSTPITYKTLARLGSPQAQADYLKHFRADSIVQDAELIRRSLLGEEGQWSVLGQSFGGFCITHYLSAAPAGLKEVLITGGLPPLERHPDDVYQATYRQVAAKNERFYERYPEDTELAQKIVTYLAENEVELPSGGYLSPERFQQLGLSFGASTGFENVHYLLENAFIQGASDTELSHMFLSKFESTFNFETNPLFAILHEAIYCQGFASNWSADRMRAAYPDFAAAPDKPVFFTGEMIYPWMFDQYKYLQPLKEAAHILAQYEDWPHLYDVTTLQKNSVPCAAVIYYNDMYVERQFSEETAKTIKGCRVWITNEYEHDGLRADGGHILGRLLDMLHGQI